MARRRTSPGEHLAEQLCALDMSAEALARKLRMASRRVIEILRGQRPVTAATARRLGRFFHTSAQFWLNLQALYDAGRGQRKARNRLIGDSRNDGECRRIVDGP